MEDREREILAGRGDFNARVVHCTKQASTTIPGAFIAVFAIGENKADASEMLAVMRCNVEQPTKFLEHIRDMIDEMLGGKVETTDLRDVQGGMQ